MRDSQNRLVMGLITSLNVVSIVILLAGCGGGTPGVVAPDGTVDTTVPDSGEPSGQPNACNTIEDCQEGQGCSEGVCVAFPPAGSNGTVTDPTTNIATDQSPDLSCLTEGHPSPAGPATATLYGAVTRFGAGLKTYDIEVSVFDASTFDPSICESEPTVSKRDTCYQEYGTPIESTMSVPVGPVQGLPEACSGHQDCPLGYRCIKADLDHTCLEQFGLFEIANVPTNTLLVIRSRATKVKTKWHDTYTFNVMLYADQVDADGRYHYDATMVSHGQWLLTPNTVGLGDIAPDNGVVGGRVRDCRVEPRDSWPISEVVLGLANPGKKFVFFNNLEDDTVPLVDRGMTNILGRFACLDVPPGWNVLAGYVNVDGEPVELGALSVYVFPSALSVLTWPGRQPHWSQQ